MSVSQQARWYSLSQKLGMVMIAAFVLVPERLLRLFGFRICQVELEFRGVSPKYKAPREKPVTSIWTRRGSSEPWPVVATWYPMTTMTPWFCTSGAWRVKDSHWSFLPGCRGRKCISWFWRNFHAGKVDGSPSTTIPWRLVGEGKACNGFLWLLDPAKRCKDRNSSRKFYTIQHMQLKVLFDVCCLFLAVFVRTRLATPNLRCCCPMKLYNSKASWEKWKCRALLYPATCMLPGVGCGARHVLRIVQHWRV